MDDKIPSNPTGTDTAAQLFPDTSAERRTYTLAEGNIFIETYLHTPALEHIINRYAQGDLKGHRNEFRSAAYDALMNCREAFHDPNPTRFERVADQAVHNACIDYIRDLKLRSGVRERIPAIKNARARLPI